MKQFNIYDILGVLAPGTLIILGLLHYYPDRAAVLRGGNLSIGEFRAIVLFAYVVGNLVAALGSLLVKPYWKMRGAYPTALVRLDDGKIITKDEFKSLEDKIYETGIVRDLKPVKDLASSECSAVTRQNLYLP